MDKDENHGERRQSQDQIEDQDNGEMQMFVEAVIPAQLIKLVFRLLVLQIQAESEGGGFLLRALGAFCLRGPRFWDRIFIALPGQWPIRRLPMP